VRQVLTSVHFRLSGLQTPHAFTARRYFSCYSNLFSSTLGHSPNSDLALIPRWRSPCSLPALDRRAPKSDVIRQKADLQPASARLFHPTAAAHLPASLPAHLTVATPPTAINPCRRSSSSMYTFKHLSSPSADPRSCCGGTPHLEDAALPVSTQALELILELTLHSPLTSRYAEQALLLQDPSLQAYQSVPFEIERRAQPSIWQETSVGASPVKEAC
jgi:hypothetical protein